ncbi:hypothetical protein Tco_0541329 [Tanacetum coccineum]
MSDSEHSTVTYTSISSDDGSLDVGSPGVIVYGYDGLPMMPDDPYSYVEAAMQVPPPPDFVPEPVYPEFMPLEDDDPKEDDDEDPEEDQADYPTDRDDEEEEESFGDDADDEEEDKGEDEEEEEHLAPADSIPPPQTCTHGARMTIPSPPLTVSSQLPISPPPLPISPTHPLGYRVAMIWLRVESPSTSHPLPLPPPIVLPRNKASMVMMRDAAPSTYCLAPPLETPPLLPILLPTSSLPLLLPSTDCRADVPEFMLLPWKRLCIAPGPRYEIGESSSAPTARSTGGFRADYGFVATLDAEIRRNLDREIGYGITDVWEDPYEIAEEIPATDAAELGKRMTYFVTTVRQDIDEIYSMDASDTTRFEVRALRTTVLAQQNKIGDLRQQAADDRHSSKAPRTRTTPATTTATTPMTDAAIRALISRGVADALVERIIQRNNNLNGDGSQGSGCVIARPVHPTREFTYTDFLKCQPMNFKGTEGVIGLTQWFERMETIFNISNCAVVNQVKFATCTLHGVALTWWKSHVKIVGQDTAYGVP